MKKIKHITRFILLVIMTVEAGLRLINHGYYTLEMREGQ
jgi:hypothetical protein